MPATSFTAERKEEILRYLKERLPAARLRHVRATCVAARSLARKHGVDAGRAELAALLHDAARGMTDREMVSYVRRHRVPVPSKSEVIARHPSLLHSFIAADIARRRFGVTDARVRSAIANHTLGSARMDALSRIIYLSDAIAPDRKYRGLNTLRTAARKDLEAALRLAMASKIEYVLAAHEWLHPVTVAAWNALVARRNNP